MPTLADLRALLEMAPDGPARQRAGGTVEGMARAYLPRTTCLARNGVFDHTAYAHVAIDERSSYGCADIDLTDPGTAHALLTALALAKGYDPRPAALAVSWTRRTVGDAYILCTPTGNWLFDVIEPDPVRALALAVAHVLSPSGDRAERVSGGDQ